jgi:hypothetical protein
VNVESIEDIMSKQEDMQADMDERAEAIMRMANKGDDEDLLDELNELEANAAASELEALEIGSGHVQAKVPAQAQGAG